MPLSDDQISMIQTSFDRLRENVERQSRYFYEALFRHAPQFRAMFREDIGGQGMKFMSTLGIIIDNLHAPEAILDEYVELGRSHARLGVKAADFKPMEEALMDTLRNELGEEFTPELERAWRTAYEEFSALMIGKGEIPD